MKDDYKSRQEQREARQKARMPKKPVAVRVNPPKPKPKKVEVVKEEGVEDAD